MKEKFRVHFRANGRTATVELCCFCRKVPDLKHPETCVHYADDYEDNECSGFVEVDDVGIRLHEALELAHESVGRNTTPNPA